MSQAMIAKGVFSGRSEWRRPWEIGGFDWRAGGKLPISFNGALGLSRSRQPLWGIFLILLIRCVPPGHPSPQRHARRSADGA